MMLTVSEVSIPGCPTSNAREWKLHFNISPAYSFRLHKTHYNTDTDMQCTRGALCYVFTDTDM